MLLQLINQVAQASGVMPYVIGGALRDTLLREHQFRVRIHDGIQLLVQEGRTEVDLVLEGDAISFAHSVLSSDNLQLPGKHDILSCSIQPSVTAGNPCYADEVKRNIKLSIFPRFGTVKLTSLSNGEEIDIATARSETYPYPGALPEVRPASLAEDLRRRDFSINTLAISLADFVAVPESARSLVALKPYIIDECHGLDDLAARSVRILHERSFVDDPTRMFRAARYATRINGTIESDTLILLKDARLAGALQTISPQRQVNEVRKILAEPEGDQALCLLRELELFAEIQLIPTNKRGDEILSRMRIIYDLLAKLPREQSLTTGDERLEILVTLYRLLQGPLPEALKIGLAWPKRRHKAIEDNLTKIKAATPDNLLAKIICQGM